MKKLIIILLFPIFGFSQAVKKNPFLSLPARKLITTTLNPADKNASVTLSGGNLIFSTSATSSGVRSVAILPSVGVYFEALINAVGSSNSTTIGVANATASLSADGGSDNNSWVFMFDNSAGSFSVHGGAFTGQGVTVSAGDRLGFEINVTAGSMDVFKNNTKIGTSMFSTTNGNALSGTLYFYVGSRSDATGNITMNFGATPFTYTNHTGFQQGF